MSDNGSWARWPRWPRNDRLLSARQANGLSQEQLARAAGVTRQAISGIESGRWSPSLDVALALARVLDLSVEELFAPAAATPPVDAELAADGPVLDGGIRRVTISDVGGQNVAFPLAEDGSFVPGFLPAAGVVRQPPPADTLPPSPDENRRLRPDRGGRRHDARAGGQKSFHSVQADWIGDAAPTLAIAGCDPALPLLQGPLARHRPPVGLVWLPCGNARALELLERGAVHAAAVHHGLRSRPRSSPDVEVIGFASWREGLALSPRHTGSVADLRDVVSGGLRVANREPGSEARRLLDLNLRKLGLPSAEVSGYETVCTAHLLVASAIGAGLAEAGVTTEPAARAFALGFIAWTHEVSELHVRRAMLDTVQLRALRDVLAGSELPRQLSALEGYDPGPCGRILVA